MQHVHRALGKSTVVPSRTGRHFPCHQHPPRPADDVDDLLAIRVAVGGTHLLARATRITQAEQCSAGMRSCATTQRKCRPGRSSLRRPSRESAERSFRLPHERPFLNGRQMTDVTRDATSGRFAQIGVQLGYSSDCPSTSRPGTAPAAVSRSRPPRSRRHPPVLSPRTAGR